MRSAFGNGSGRRRTPLTRLKIAVLAPMPRASAQIATTLNPLVFSSIRAPKPRSWKNVSILSASEREHRISAGRAPCRNVTREQPNQGERERNEKKCWQVERAHFVKHRAQNRCSEQRDDQTDDRPRANQGASVRNDEA